MLVPAGIVTRLVSLVPSDDRYATLKPPTSAAELPALTSSTNSFEAAPVEPVMNSFTRISALEPPAEGTHLSVAMPVASYVSAAAPATPARWQPTPFRLSSDGSEGPAGPCAPVAPFAPAAPGGPVTPGEPASPF